MEENTDRDVESAGGEDALVGNVNKLTQHRKTISENRVIFNVVNFSKTKSLYRDGMSPVVKSTSRPKWQRLPPKNVYYYRCPDHRRNYVMSFAFCFDREDDVYQFAYCYPYTYTRLQHYLASLERRNLPYLQREQLGLSVVSPRMKNDTNTCCLCHTLSIFC
uniref:AGBL carboxypeptidase 4 n=1 Tax=Xiphophorus couchianus TaxID=32473 RepID=A0A3B5LTQ5_9TELE